MNSVYFVNSVNSGIYSTLLSYKRVISYGCLPLLLASMGLKSSKKEGVEIADEQRLSLIEILFPEKEGKKSQVAEEIVSAHENIAPLDPSIAKRKVKEKEVSSESEELKSFVKTATPREMIEKEEAFLLPSDLLLTDPTKAIEIASENTKNIPEEVELVKCHENGAYQVVIEQKLRVNITPEIKQQTKICKGHQKHSEYTWKKDANKARDKLKNKLRKNPSVQESHVHVTEGGFLKKYVVKADWKHFMDTSCNNYTVEETLLQHAKEEDFWETDNPKLLDSLQGDPACHLLYSQVIDGPQTKTIQEKSVFRATWERNLFFACGRGEDAKCRRLRELGGILINKRCLQETEFGECRQWEKTYDLGRKAAYQTTSFSFNKGEIWGLENNALPPQEKNRDLPEVATKLSVFSEIKKEMESSNIENSQLVQIFKGEPFKCQRSFIKGALYDCCKKMNGLAVQAKLAHCSSEEKCLSQKRSEGKCHFIGTFKEKLGTETHQVFCCFQSKLSRVVHEEGRRQLGLKWGSAKKPCCRGFSVQELQHIDFSKIDLSEALEDLPISQDEFLRKLTGSSQHYKLDIGNNSLKAQIGQTIRLEQQKLKEAL